MTDKRRKLNIKNKQSNKISKKQQQQKKENQTNFLQVHGSEIEYRQNEN